MKKLDIKIGDRFKRLTITALLPSKNKRRMVRAACDCGNEKDYILQNITIGDSSSCGCLRNESVSNAVRRHGMNKSKTHDVWNYIKFVKKEVCDKWNGFEGFYSDMGEKPENMKLARLDKSKPYSKENCAWVWRSETYKRRISSFVKA